MPDPNTPGLINALLASRADIIDGEVVQPVRMTDAEGHGWIAIYPMQRQPDGTWRTDGCQLGRLAGQQI